MDEEAKRQRQREATRRWRVRNPEKVAAGNRKKRPCRYDPVKMKSWRDRRFQDPDYRKRVNAAANERVRSIRGWINDYKLSVGCVDCGYRLHHAGLEFDHVEGVKKLNVCSSKSIAQAKSEIAKCVVRCANCHGIKTWERLQKETPSTDS